MAQFALNDTRLSHENFGKRGTIELKKNGIYKKIKKIDKNDKKEREKEKRNVRTKERKNKTYSINCL